MTPRGALISTAALVIVIALGAIFFLMRAPVPSAPPTATSTGSGQVPVPPVAGTDIIELGIGQMGALLGVTIMPREVVEDSRCPASVQCVQAGTVRVRAMLVSGLGTSTPIFLLGEPVTTEAEAVTLVEVRPAKATPGTIPDSQYRFVFKVVKQGYTYDRASSDLIRVTTPTPGAVVGKQFRVRGQARGNWFFEASFPIEVRDKSGRVLAIVPAQAEGEWMTTNFVPYTANLTIPASYTGPATLILRKDNASGLPEHDASVSFPITIEF